jgi:protein-arginine kinase activator protein McsA
VAAVVDRVCEECGTTFAAKTNRARFCSTAHRVRANRRPSKVGKAKDDAARKPAKKVATKKATAKKPAAKAKDADSPPPPAPVYDTLAEQLKNSLTELQALDTIAGMAALRIAQQIDRGQDSGSAVATLSKELSRLVGEAKLEAAPKIRDRVDDITTAASEKMLRLVK